MAAEEPIDSDNERGGGAATAKPQPKPREKSRSKPDARRKPDVRKLPPFNVVLLDDDQHSYAYVIEMLGKIFGYPDEKGYKMASEVDSTGRVIVFTSHKELAELKRDQIVGFGPDRLMATSKTSMRAVVEPAEG